MYFPRRPTDGACQLYHNPARYDKIPEKRTRGDPFGPPRPGEWFQAIAAGPDHPRGRQRKRQGMPRIVRGILCLNGGG